MVDVVELDRPQEGTLGSCVVVQPQLAQAHIGVGPGGCLVIRVAGGGLEHLDAGGLLAGGAQEPAVAVLDLGVARGQ